MVSSGGSLLMRDPYPVNFMTIIISRD